MVRLIGLAQGSERWDKGAPCCHGALVLGAMSWQNTGFGLLGVDPCAVCFPGRSAPTYSPAVTFCTKKYTKYGIEASLHSHWDGLRGVSFSLGRGFGSVP